MQKEVHYVPYEARFGTDIPVAGFPLPIPAALPGEIHAKWWTDLLDYAETYVQRTPEQLTGVPQNFRNRRREHAVISALAADIVVGLDFYAQWTSRKAQERYKDIDTESLAEQKREAVLRAVGIARSRDWARFVVDEYLQALQRCRALCDATRRGHLAEVGAVLCFRKEDVEKVMDGSREFVGLINYDHIRTILLMEATRSASPGSVDQEASPPRGGLPAVSCRAPASTEPGNACG